MGDWFSENKPKDAGQEDWFASNGPTSGTAPKAPLTLADPAHPAVGATRRFLSSAVDAVNPVPAIQEWLNRPDELRKFQEAGHIAIRAHKEGRKLTPEEEAIVDRGLAANVGTMGQPPVIPAGAVSAVMAAQQAKTGDLAGAAGTLVGGYGVPMATGASLSRVKPTPGATPPRMSRRLYQSALKPQTGAALSPLQRTKILSTGIRERIPVSEGGYERLVSREKGLRNQIETGIDERSPQVGAVGDPDKIAGRVEEIRPKFERQVNPQDDLAALSASKAEFLEKHTEYAPYTKIGPASPDEGGFVPVGEGKTPIRQPMTMREMQDEKKGTYQNIGDKAYGELKSASIEAQKALARGLKEELEAQWPELKQLNGREKALIDLQKQMERYIARHGNRDAIGIGTPIKATAMEAIAPGAGAKAGMLAGFLEFPGVKSRLAIAIDRATTTSRRAAPTLSKAALLSPLLATPQTPEEAEEERRRRLALDLASPEPLQ
jgi:hypothetical protein